ncbi:MAG: hypothetical protein E7564_03020 [Ruminococcaceae bacterium]|nr:hypothetical protein [Oscillospiraceae bacterium]
MKKIIIEISLLLVMIFITACGNSVQPINSENEIQLEKEVIVKDRLTSYRGYTSYQDALTVADKVVYGTIIEIGDPIVVNHGNEDLVIKSYYTPITIEVIEYIKGNSNSSTIVYNALGAELEDVIYDYEAYDTLDFKVGDKLLVYLSERNQCIGPQCVISEDDKGVSTRSTLQGIPDYSLEKHVELAKNAYSKMLADEKVTE